MVLAVLSFSLPIPLRLYTLPYWYNPPFLIFWHSGTLALSPERQSARMSKIKNGGLVQYGAEPFEQQQFGAAGVEGVKSKLGMDTAKFTNVRIALCEYSRYLVWIVRCS